MILPMVRPFFNVERGPWDGNDRSDIKKVRCFLTTVKHWANGRVIYSYIDCSDDYEPKYNSFESNFNMWYKASKVKTLACRTGWRPDRSRSIVNSAK